MKRFTVASAIILSFVLLSSTLFVYGANMLKNISVTYRNISILVNGRIIPSEQEPFIYQGRTFVPLRTIGEAVNKTVEWDNAKNQVSITDKPTESAQNFLSFPIHKVGERVEAYPYAITIQKVYIARTPEKYFIDLVLENLSDHEMYKFYPSTFVLFDDQGNKYRSCDGRHNVDPLPAKGVAKNARIQFNYEEAIKNKSLILVFEPIQEENREIVPSNELNVFLAFDLGKIE